MSQVQKQFNSHILYSSYHQAHQAAPTLDKNHSGSSSNTASGSSSSSVLNPANPPSNPASSCPSSPVRCCLLYQSTVSSDIASNDITAVNNQGSFQSHLQKVTSSGSSGISQSGLSSTSQLDLRKQPIWILQEAVSLDPQEAHSTMTSPPSQPRIPEHARCVLIWLP